MKQKGKISVTVITGFLGAGKTTFINFLLKEYPEVQFALVENEFGEAAIDTKLIKGLDANQLFELKQGCICCTITNEFELVLQELAERFPHVEHLLIETTGIADPVPVIRPFFRDENLKNLYTFNGTICMVDALNFEIQPEKEISLKQLAVADEIVVSKSESFQQEKKRRLEKKLKGVNPLPGIHFSEYGNVKSLDLFSVSVKNNYRVERGSAHLHSQVQTKTITFSQPLNKQDFTRWFAYTLDVYKNEIYRVKGIFCFQNEVYEYILQGMGGNFEITEGENLVSGGESTMVLIGKVREVSFDYPG